MSPIIFGLFSSELWTAVKMMFCPRDKVKKMLLLYGETNNPIL